MKELLPLFTGPSRYLGTEPGTVHKDPEAVSVRLALAFPDMYEVGMSYLGQKILYGIVNARDEFWAERVFAPDADTAALLREHKANLSTLESDTDLCDMDCVAFHLTHELCYTNILYMLDLGGVPLLASDRGEGDPLIMAGGGCTFNAEPVAPYFDLMVLGDGEEVLPEILERQARAKARGETRNELLKALRLIPGVYIPSLFEPMDGTLPLRALHDDYTSVEKRIVADMDEAMFPPDHIVPIADAVHDRFAVEIARGCTRGCRFCQAGIIYRPARERSPKVLSDIIGRGLESTGFEDLSFLSLSTGDYSALEQVFAESITRCRENQISISLPSLRVGSVSDRIMALMSSIRRTGATIAPEAGSQRLRDVINKGVTEEGLMTHVRKLFDNGWQMVKLYFMIGLPTERPEDLDAIVDLCLKVRDCAGAHVKRMQVTAAVSPFVPKPHTPFQWERQLTIDEVRERVGYLHSEFKRHKRLKLRWHIPEMSALEGVFSRGGRELAPVVRRAYDKGALFSSWKDHLDLSVWHEALAEMGFDDPEHFLRERAETDPLPWDHLNSGVTRRFLSTERRRSLETKLTSDCRYNACRNCGVCNFEGRTSTLTSQAQTQEIRPRVVQDVRDQDDAVEGPEHQSVADVPAEPKPAPRPQGKGKARPPDIGPLAVKAAHYRVWHTKLGEMQYVSQVEIQRMLERLLRRGGVPISFSSGFHPLPRLSFGRALPVGVQSEREWFNLMLRVPMGPEELTRRLTPQLPRDFDLIMVETLGMGKKQRQAVAEDFVLEFEPGQASERFAQWEHALGEKEILWTRETRKGERTTDLRPIIHSAEPMDERRLAIRFDWRERYISPLRLTEQINPDMAMNRFVLRKVRQWMDMPD